MNSSSMLGDIRAIYKKAKADGEDTFTCETTFDPIEDISLTQMSFHFDGKTYKLVDNIKRGFFFSYVDGKKRQYINSRKLVGMLYVFDLVGAMKYKGGSVAESLAEGISQELGGTIEKKESKERSSFLIKRDEKCIAIVNWSREIEEIMVGLEME